MHPLHSAIIAPELSDALKKTELSHKHGDRQEQLGKVGLMLRDEWYRSFKIIEITDSKEELQSLENQGYRLIDYQVYRRTEKYHQHPTRHQALLRLSSSIKTFNADLNWLECAIERSELTGQKIELPPTSRCQVIQNHGLPAFETIAFSIQLSKIQGD